MKTFDEYRIIEQVNLVELDDDEWVVKHEGILENDIIEVLDDDGNVIEELEIIETLGDVTRAVSRYNKAKTAQYRAVGGGTRREKGLDAFKTQIKGRAKAAANVMTFGIAYKKRIEKGKSNFSRSFSGTVDNAKRAERGWSPKDARIKKK